MKKVCVVIPTHQKKLVVDDERSFLQALKVFKNREIKVVIPDNIDDEYYKSHNVEIIKVNSKWMESKVAYNRMSCDKNFYMLFEDYEYILVYETDAWVFEDRLDYFMDMEYDYYGAPWPHLSDKVGNSGFSLRNVQK